MRGKARFTAHVERRRAAEQQRQGQLAAAAERRVLPAAPTASMAGGGLQMRSSAPAELPTAGREEPRGSRFTRLQDATAIVCSAAFGGQYGRLLTRAAASLPC